VVQAAGSRVERRAQLVWRVERRRHHNVDRGQLRLGADRIHQRLGPASTRDHDRGGTSGQRAEGTGQIRGTFDPNAGVHQHGPTVALKLPQAEQENRRGSAAPPAERPGGIPPLGGTLMRSTGPHAVSQESDMASPDYTLGKHTSSSGMRPGGRLVPFPRNEIRAAHCGPDLFAR
jgi:hypothetical protein